MECRSWTLDEMEGSYKCLLTRFETSFNCRLTKKSKKGFLTILNWHLGGKKNSSVGRVNQIQRQRCRTIPTDRLRSATLCGRRMRHHSSPSCLGRQALQGRCNYLNGRSGDRPESSKNWRPERLRSLCANACQRWEIIELISQLGVLLYILSKNSICCEQFTSESEIRGESCRNRYVN